MFDCFYFQSGDYAHDITPLHTLSARLHLLRLSNGPTLAFKDIAMQLLGNLFEYMLQKEDESVSTPPASSSSRLSKKRSRCCTIVGATSGDTGSSAEHAFAGRKNIELFMLSPYQRMSAFQTAQMYSIDAKNVHNIAVKGMGVRPSYVQPSRR